MAVILDLILITAPLMVWWKHHFSSQPGQSLTDELRSLEVFAFGQWFTTYSSSFPHQSQQQWTLNHDYSQPKHFRSILQYINPCSAVYIPPNHQPTTYTPPTLPAGGTAAAVSIIIPVVLYTLGVGYLFMQEDTVELNLSSGLDVAPTSIVRIGYGSPIPLHGNCGYQ